MGLSSSKKRVEGRSQRPFAGSIFTSLGLRNKQKSKRVIGGDGGGDITRRRTRGKRLAPRGKKRKEERGGRGKNRRTSS